jgi:hypothetical protein
MSIISQRGRRPRNCGSLDYKIRTALINRQGWQRLVNQNRPNELIFIVNRPLRRIIEQERDSEAADIRARGLDRPQGP